MLSVRSPLLSSLRYSMVLTAPRIDPGYLHIATFWPAFLNPSETQPAIGLTIFIQVRPSAVSLDSMGDTRVIFSF